MSNPLDELNVQIPGRVMVLEILVTMLLRGKSNRRALLAEAEGVLQLYEQAIHQDGIGTADDYALKVFEAARFSLDSIRLKSGG